MAFEVDVLHVEDDDDWASLVALWLKAEGLTVRRVRSRRELREAAAGPVQPGCIVLDLCLEDGDGLEACAELKRTPHLQAVPVVVFTSKPVPAHECLAREAVYQVVKGQWASRELPAAILSLLKQQARTRGRMDAGDLTLDPSDHSVRVNGRAMASLAAGPFAALTLLVSASPQPVADERLYGAFIVRRVYETRDPELAQRQTVRDYVSRLRSELGKDLASRIVRVKGAGYAYVPPEPLSRL